MKKEKVINDFLKIEFKKFILPVFLIILFIYQTHVYFSIGNFGDETYCYMIEQRELMESYSQNNNYALLGKAINETEIKINQLGEDFNVNVVEKPAFNFISSISKIYPIFPVSCEIEVNPVKHCRYYFSKESYDCTLELYTIMSGGDSDLMKSMFKSNFPDYKKISMLLILIHFILIFIWGYLLSAILLFAFRKIKRKIRKK